MPAHNEEQSVGDVVRELKHLGGYSVIVVDDHSEDSTAEVAEASGADIVISLPIQLGAWRATQTGVKIAVGEGADTIITMDADGQHDVREIATLTTALQNGLGNVIVGSYERRITPLRNLAWRFLRLVSGLQIRDLTSGFKAYKKEVGNILVTEEASMLEYQDVGLLMLLEQHGAKISEVPVSMNPRLCGTSKVFTSWLSVAYFMVAATILSLSKRRSRKGKTLWKRGI